MASGLLSLLNGGGSSAPPASAPQQQSSSSTAPPATTIDQLFARLNTGPTAPKPSQFPAHSQSPATVPLPPSQASSPYGGPPQNGQNAFPGLHTPTPRSSQLLGLLGPAGMQSASLDYIPHSTGTPAPLGVIGTPSPLGSVSSRSPPLKEDRAQNLLAALMGGGSPAPQTPTSPPPHLAQTHQQPLIHHASPPPSTISAPPAAPSAEELPPPRIKSPEPAIAALPALATESSSTSEDPIDQGIKAEQAEPIVAKKPLFSFISPFDAFDEPIKPKAAPSTPSPAPGMASGAGKKAAASKKDKGKAKKAGPAAGSSASAKGDETDTRSISRRSSTSESQKATPVAKVKAEKIQAEKEKFTQSLDVPAPAPSITAHSLQTPAPLSKTPSATPSRSSTPAPAGSAIPEPSSPAGTPSKRKLPTLNIPYPASSYMDSRVSSNVVQEYQGNNLTIDVSQPNQAGIAHDFKSIINRKISLVNTDTLTLGPINEGKAVAVGGRMVAYALSKQGRIRVLDEDTGHNTLVEFPVDTEGKAQKVWDLAVSGDHYVTAVSVLGWIAVWQINVRVAPTGDENNVSCDLVATQQPEEFGQAWKVLYPGEGRSPWVLTGNVVRQLTLSQGQHGLTSRKAVEGSGATLVDFAVLADGHIALLSNDGKLHLSHLASESKFEGQVPSTVAMAGRDIACSSLDAVGENLLVGYGRGRAWKLVRPSTLSAQGEDAAPLDIRYEGDTTMPIETGFGVSAYDGDVGILYLSCFPRASLFAISIRDVDQCDWTVRYLEVPVEAIGSFAVSTLGQPTGESELFMKNPKGFNQLAFRPPFAKALIGSKPVVVRPPPVKAKPVPKQVKAPASTPSAAVRTEAKSPNSEATPSKPQSAPQADQPAETGSVPSAEAVTQPAEPDIQVKQEEIDDVKPDVTGAREPSGNGVSSASAGISSRQLSEMEDRLFARLNKSFSEQLQEVGTAQIAQIEKAQFASQAADTERQEAVLRLVSEALNRDVKDTLASMVQSEIQSTVLPVILAGVKTQIQQVTGPELVSTVHKNIQNTVMTEVERMLVPHLAKTFTSALTPIVERNVRASIERDFLPRYLQSVQATNETVLKQIRQEWQGLRQSHSEQLNAPKVVDPLLQQLTAQIASLQEQLKSVGEDVAAIKRRPPPQSPIGMTAIPSGYPPQGLPAPPPSLHMNGAGASGFAAAPQYIVSPPARNSAPSSTPAEDVEEVFLSAFSSLGDDALADFVMSRQAQTPYYLPNPAAGAGKGPLSQAVLLTMIHKLSKCLEGRSPASPMFQICLGWVFRAAYLIDPQDPSISAYLPQIRSALNQQFRTVAGAFSQVPSNDPSVIQAKNAAASTMDQIIRRLS